MNALFQQSKIGRLELRNRFIRAASHEGLADSRGNPTVAQFEFYRGFVEGGVGLVITGYAGVAQSGKSPLHHMTMVDSDDLIPAHRQMVEQIHRIGGRIVLQIAHCGRQTRSSVTGNRPLAPSAVTCRFYRERPEEMDESQIQSVVEAFAQAGRRARQAGYDGVQIHAAHGYLLSSFLSQHTNRRNDRWGESPENRFRIVDEVLRAVRDSVGDSFPVLIKLNSDEQARRGTKPDDCVRFAEMVEKTGCCDAVELSCGTMEEAFYMARGAFPTAAILRYLRPYCDYSRASKFLMKATVVPFVKWRQPRFFEGYNLAAAARVKQRISLPVITLGGMRSRRFMEEAIASGRTDFVSMARPLIAEPDLVHRFAAGKTETARCDNCNQCLAASDTRPIRCYQ